MNKLRELKLFERSAASNQQHVKEQRKSDTTNKLSLSDIKKEIKEIKENLINSNSKEQIPQHLRATKYQQLIELNVKFSNDLYSSTQVISDKIAVDWERVRAYCNNQLKELQKVAENVSSINSTHYKLISEYEHLKDSAHTLLPDFSSDKFTHIKPIEQN